MSYLDDFESYPPNSVSLSSLVWLFSAISHLGLQAESKTVRSAFKMKSCSYLWQRCICPSLKIFLKAVVLFVTAILWFWSIAELFILESIDALWTGMVILFYLDGPQIPVQTVVLPGEAVSGRERLVWSKGTVGGGRPLGVSLQAVAIESDWPKVFPVRTRAWLIPEIKNQKSLFLIYWNLKWMECNHEISSLTSESKFAADPWRRSLRCLSDGWCPLCWTTWLNKEQQLTKDLICLTTDFEWGRDDTEQQTLDRKWEGRPFEMWRSHRGLALDMITCKSH